MDLFFLHVSIHTYLASYTQYGFRRGKYIWGVNLKRQEVIVAIPERWCVRKDFGSTGKWPSKKGVEVPLSAFPKLSKEQFDVDFQTWPSYTVELDFL